MPDCPALVLGRGKCGGACCGGRCKDREYGPGSTPRPSASEQGYGARWRKVRDPFIAANPICVDCGAPSTDADHAPVSRRDLIARGVADPDAWEHLQARCHPCHSRRTVLVDGGWGKAKPTT